MVEGKLAVKHGELSIRKPMLYWSECWTVNEGHEVTDDSIAEMNLLD